MNNNTNFVSLDEAIKKYIDQIEILLPLGYKLLKFLIEKKPIKKRNIIIYAFLHKTVRILDAIRYLFYEGFEEEAQILARVILETKINFDYFLIIANKDLDKAYYRVVDAVLLEKMKALKSTNFIISGHQEDRNKWYKIEKEIKSRYTDDDFKQLKRYGFSGLSLKSRAIKTNNDAYYNFAYRLYSKHVHSTDLNEQLFDVLPNHNILRYIRTRILSLFQTAFNCSVTIISDCNNWLGKPITWPV